MKDSLESLIATLKDRKAKVADRVKAAEGLSGYDDDRAREALIEVLNGSGEDLRDAIVGALKTRAHVERLIVWLSSMDEEKRRAGASAFKYIWDERARENLHAALRSGKGNDLRLEAAWALALHPDEKSRLALVGALNDSEPLVRVWASRGLEKIAKPEDEPALARALDDENEDVRVFAGKVLGHIGSESAKTALRRRIEREPSYRVQQALKASLGE
jgi:HEAT repeat protein